MQAMWVQSLVEEDPLEEGMMIHSSILAWRIPWTEEPGGPQSKASQSEMTEHVCVCVRAHTHTHTHTHTPSQGLCTALPCVCFLQGFSHAVSSTSRFLNIHIPEGPLPRTLSKVGSLVSQLVSIKTPSSFIYLSLLTWNYTSMMCLSHWNVSSLKAGWCVSAFLWYTQCWLQSKLA